jgi:hypothetical protein
MLLFTTLIRNINYFAILQQLICRIIPRPLIIQLEVFVLFCFDIKAFHVLLIIAFFKHFKIKLRIHSHKMTPSTLKKYDYILTLKFAHLEASKVDIKVRSTYFGHFPLSLSIYLQ